MANRKLKKHSFTLIELLVVISIIALLIALLLPALQNARKTAQAAGCMSNARQLAVATTNYALDNNSWYPRAMDTVTSPSWDVKTHYFWTLLPYYNDRAVLADPGRDNSADHNRGMWLGQNNVNYWFVGHTYMFYDPRLLPTRAAIRTQYDHVVVPSKLVVPEGTGLGAALAGSLILVSDLHAGDIYACTFDKNGWKSNDWIFVRRPDLRQDLDEGWIQGKNYIENNNPTHTSMVYGKKLKADLTVSSTMSFGDEMAPSIVIAVHLDRNEKDQLEYQEHFEIVLYNKGVNVWLHRNKNGKSHWTKTAFWKFRLEKDTKYVMTVTIKEKELTFSVGDRKFGYAEGNLPDEFYVGITGQEGINRFYNFRVHE